MKKSVISEHKILVYLYALGLVFFLCFNVFIAFGEQQFALLAQSFLQGHLFLGPSGISLDASYYKGLAYWPQGVFPAIVMVPFVALFQSFVQQGHVQFLLNILNIFLLYKISLKITGNQKTSLWLSFAYIFATAYMVVGLIPWSWWYAHVVSTACLLLLIYEYFYKRRWFVMGIYVAFAMATRIDLLFAVVFPILMIFFLKQKVRQKVSSILQLVVPIFLGLGLITFYNFLRFGEVFEFGYSYHIAAIASAQGMFEKYGVWNFFYYPTNFYYLFVKGIEAVFVPGTAYLTFPFLRADPWGMSIVLTSPIFLWCLKTKKKELLVKVAAVTILCMLLFLLGYFGIGARQYGYRYALDFYPFLFIILCFAFQKGMSWKVKTVIIASFLFNIILFPSIFIPAV